MAYDGKTSARVAFGFQYDVVSLKTCTRKSGQSCTLFGLVTRFRLQSTQSFFLGSRKVPRHLHTLEQSRFDHYGPAMNLQETKSQSNIATSQQNTGTFQRLYRSHQKDLELLNRALLQCAVRKELPPIVNIKQEYCFYIQFSRKPSQEEEKRLYWLLSDPLYENSLSERSFFPSDEGSHPCFSLEIGPRLNFQTAWSSNAVTICQSCGLSCIERIERSKRYFLEWDNCDKETLQPIMEQFTNTIHDRMTEMVYSSPLQSFETPERAAPIQMVPLKEKGMTALIELNQLLGLGLDEWDMKYYYDMFVNDLKRNPTVVELFDIAQSNSEHSRHWFFKGRIFLNGEEMSSSLLDMVRETWQKSPHPSVLAFCDNSSSIMGDSQCWMWSPEKPGKSLLSFPSKLTPNVQTMDITCTAETHNFPCGVAPFPGAETGSGGRIRDMSATGVGSLVIAGTAGYSSGIMVDEQFDWEDKSFSYPNHLASCLKILIEASNGASDYGNKFGEPLIAGFTRSFGMRLLNGERREYIKPIMFSGGIGQMQHRHAYKESPQVGMLVVKIGGPAYRIGMGGGAASSMYQGENKEELDFGAVQRGDAEMEQKTYRVIRCCVELGENNPIVSIHDQGAGGNCNVVKELIYPSGARIDIRKLWIGDKTLSVLELWGAEYQEQYGLLIRPDSKELFSNICARENVTASYIGTIDGSGRIVVFDSETQQTAVDMELERVLGKLPQKCFYDEFIETECLKPLNMSFLSRDEWQRYNANEKKSIFMKVFERILRLPSVGSKAFLTNKAMKYSMSFEIFEMAYIKLGPLQLPLADCAVVAMSYFGETGIVTAIGEQCIKSLLSPAAMARMAVAEMVTNLAGCKITSLSSIRCEANWMWPAKMPGEGANLYQAVRSLRDMLLSLGIAVDGGKDSLSMATKVVSSENESQLVKAPGTLVLSGYAFVPNIRKKVTPDIKRPGTSGILYIDLAHGKRRLGASAFSQVHKQLGDECPDLDDFLLLKRAFDAVQSLIEQGKVLSYHDVGEGGLLTALAEMAMAGNCGLDICFANQQHSPFAFFFAEESGMLIEVEDHQLEFILIQLHGEQLPCWLAAITTNDFKIQIQYNGESLMERDIRDIRSIWDSTSFQLEKLQADVSCAVAERKNRWLQTGPRYHLTFQPQMTSSAILHSSRKHKVAVIRVEGTNGDRELAVAFHLAGFEVWDVHMKDIENASVSLDSFSGVAFPGGFSFADVLDSSKGWAGIIRYLPQVRAEFQRFYNRKDTFSLGVCNGCQLMAWLGWIPNHTDTIVVDSSQALFIQNKSGRFESRFSSVKILPSVSIMLRGMEDSVLGIWCAHGEGQTVFTSESYYEQVVKLGLAPIRYVDDEGIPTEDYPWNPNGSRQGIAALCSMNGRHLALMPHPERVVFPWQWSYYPETFPQDTSPWIRMFQNAREWCEQQKHSFT
ncbi:phosphoribosylformylglycinamidine synthase isoform 1 [Galdieria sulphuraria]|uniref:phosphoribosylformylglycinamidine synthase n=1 Tax=Galdieria sulphuraria TaxID=130081 RepID=M2WUH5_GALSU|nr:phosphoribosylformylglycinamidine synthase isoform 1 [Galdieria sulphuraria]EME27590.1 phosphoribosylformylglycinamidine synthase isoform 1 [Galdieria sulphuraria]|eukprot:XP_005704110.1 phosphoribosylformylglycinamidine synthase isoform 1 [Galdieria sulphuraria]